MKSSASIITIPPTVTRCAQISLEKYFLHLISVNWILMSFPFIDKYSQKFSRSICECIKNQKNQIKCRKKLKIFQNIHVVSENSIRLVIDQKARKIYRLTDRPSFNLFRVAQFTFFLKFFDIVKFSQSKSV